MYIYYLMCPFFADSPLGKLLKREDMNEIIPLFFSFEFRFYNWRRGWEGEEKKERRRNEEK